jgi:hypothetical protein
METYKSFALRLLELLGNDNAVRLTVDGYMPLSIEDIGRAGEGQRLVSLCHYGKQNGDLMRDPDVVFMFHEMNGLTFAEPVSFRNDYMGVLQEVYEYSDTGVRRGVRPKLKRELKSFARTWFENLRQQGFFGPEARRDVLS